MLDSNYFTKQNCPVCKSDKYSVIYKNVIHTCNVLEVAKIPYLNKDVKTSVNVCRNCNHKYLNETIKNEFLTKYYNEIESEFHSKNDGNQTEILKNENKIWANYILKYCPNTRSLLEIGCGSGFLLNRLRKKGFETYGIEPSLSASNFAKNKLGLNVVKGFLDTNTFVDKKFDIIILFDVIEHIDNLENLMDLIKFYLSSNGYVVIMTGNVDSFFVRLCGKKWLYFFSWEHISFFNKKSISFLLNQNKFKLIRFKKINHESTNFINFKIVIQTIIQKIRMNFSLDKKQFHNYMAFDHFIAIAKKI